MKNIHKIEIVTEKETVTADAEQYVKVTDNKIVLAYDKAPVFSVKINWENTYFCDALLLGDTWERAYGDMEWKTIDASGKMPWYFYAYADKKIHAFGVKT